MENSAFPPSCPSRRSVLAVAAATVSLPMIEAAVGNIKSARAAAGGTPPAPKPAWISTKLKPEDVKDNQFTAVTGQKIMLSRTGKDISALTTVCTHRGSTVAIQADQKTVTCPAHKSMFNLDGSVNKGPATLPLQHYAIRLTEGVIEVDPGQKVAKDAKEATLTVT